MLSNETPIRMTWFVQNKLDLSQTAAATTNRNIKHHNTTSSCTAEAGHCYEYRLFCVLVLSVLVIMSHTLWWRNNGLYLWCIAVFLLLGAWVLIARQAFIQHKHHYKKEWLSVDNSATGYMVIQEEEVLPWVAQVVLATQRHLDVTYGAKSFALNK